jgi:DNA-binding response OmpR family regulator
MESSKVVILTKRSKLGNQIENAFRGGGFEVFRTDQVDKILDLLQEKNPQALILDSEQANGKIIEIVRLTQERYLKTGLVLLSNNKKQGEQVEALEQGVDECYVGMPQLDELVAKVKAIIRRINLVDHSPRTLRIKDIEINLNIQEVRKNGRRIDLTYTQFKLLYLLASNRDIIFTRNDILNQVWGENAYVTDRTVDVHVKRLREKLGEENEALKYIQTIHGLGYRFT